MSHSCVQPVPAWVSGHELNGQPLRSDGDGHLAIIPLPFVGGAHADGHLLGVGLVFPRSVDRRERGKVLGKLLLDEAGQPRRVQLTLGRLGEWTVVKRDWAETRQTLAPETWTGQPRSEGDRSGADTWASVTPVVLDRFPKSDHLRDRQVWTQEVAEIISAACVRIGLREPVDVDIDTTSWHLGSPRATCKRRPLRGHAGLSDDAGAAFGEGFPPFPARGTNAPRPQVHVWLRFAKPVVGPILLGAGRYLGYGLCKPLKENRR
jgi:CRISPR-associated protein Csb2